MQRTVPFELEARPDIQIVPVTSVRALLRYRKDPLIRSLPPTVILKWLLNLLCRRNRLFLAVRDGKCVHFTWCGLSRHGDFGDVCDPQGYTFGQSATDTDCWGQGIYPYVLRWIVNRLIESHKASHFYIATRPENVKSIRGILKAAFVFRGLCDYGWRLHPLLFKRASLKPMSSLDELNVPQAKGPQGTGGA